MNRITIYKNIGKLASILDKITILDKLKLIYKNKDELVRNIKILLKDIKADLQKELNK